MEEKSQSASRRTRFLDNKIIFQGVTTIGAHAVLHDVKPDLGTNEIDVLKNTEHSVTLTDLTDGVTTIDAHAVLHDVKPDLGTNEIDALKNTEHSVTLTDLTDELNDLRRKMRLLKESLKVKRNMSGKRNWSSQATEISNLTDVFGAKRIIHDCIAELNLANNFFDGNEQMAAINSEKLQRLVIEKDCKDVAIVIEGLSIARVNPMTRGESLVDDSTIGTSENFFNEHRKEAAMQTEANDIFLPDKNITKSHASPRTIDEADEKTSQRNRKKKRKWFSSCCTKREKKSNEKIEKWKKSNRTSIGKLDEKSSTSGRVVICEDDL